MKKKGINWNWKKVLASLLFIPLTFLVLATINNLIIAINLMRDPSFDLTFVMGFLLGSGLFGWFSYWGFMKLIAYIKK